jgi:hypothetical protein
MTIVYIREKSMVDLLQLGARSKTSRASQFQPENERISRMASPTMTRLATAEIFRSQGKFGRAVLISLLSLAALLPTYSSAQAQAKTDVRGFKLGMTETELVDKLRLDGFKCSKDPGSSSLSCNGGEHHFNFYFSEYLSPRLVIKVQYLFDSNAEPSSVVKSVADQYKPKWHYAGDFRAKGSLPEGIEISIDHHQGQLWSLALTSTLLVKRDSNQDEQNRKSAPLPRF